jgi:hypothetical protein
LWWLLTVYLHQPQWAPWEAHCSPGYTKASFSIH